MSRENYVIFQEGSIGKLTVKNRLVRSATCEYQMEADGRVTDKVLDVYRNLAQGGVGMIITGLMAIHPRAKGVKGQICIYNEVCAAEASKIADAVHQTDPSCRVIAQLCHPGRQITYENLMADCVGPSEVESPLLVRKARALSVEEIESIVRNFIDAIDRAKQSGFDGVQLHAAHGYLLNSFLSPYTNRRTDEYGGSIENRVRIIKEIVLGAREKVGDFPILIKINCDDHVEGGIRKEDLPEIIKEIEATGVDAIEVSGAMWDCLVHTKEELGFVPIPLPEARTQIKSLDKQSYYYDYVKNLRVSIPIILVGGHRNIERMETILQEGVVDFLSLSRPLIAEPELPNRWKQGIGNDNASCISCNACIVY
jgi:2,4-dienoyl-CoA reductase-like NADH-dependent reductase (Old Yellow Enzyme family)